MIGVLAAREAWFDAGLAHGEPGAGVVIGSGGGGLDVAERQYEAFFSGNSKRVSPYEIAVSIVGIVSSEISIALRLTGISHVLSNGCTELDGCDRLRRSTHPHGRGGRPVLRGDGRVA